MIHSQTHGNPGVPSLACSPASDAADSTFNWLVQPSVDGIPVDLVYADGTRFFSHGWAFVVVDEVGRIVAGASGVLPSWSNGIYGARLWAVLQAASYASPGSPLHVDFNAVKIEVHNGIKFTPLLNLSTTQTYWKTGNTFVFNLLHKGLIDAAVDTILIIKIVSGSESSARHLHLSPPAISTGNSRKS